MARGDKHLGERVRPERGDPRPSGVTRAAAAAPGGRGGWGVNRRSRGGGAGATEVRGVALASARRAEVASGTGSA